MSVLRGPCGGPSDAAQPAGRRAGEPVVAELVEALAPDRVRVDSAERIHHDQRRAELRAGFYAGIAIRDAREEAGLSRTELAARIGIAQSALSRIEAGRVNLTLGTLPRVTDALGVPLRLGVGSHEVAIPVPAA